MTVDQLLKCHVVELAYNFENKHGDLFMDDGHCCDMDACIRLFQKIDPNVGKIQTHSGADLDTRYVFVGGRWNARS